MKAKTITFYSQKGGVGKTFIAVNTANALALSGHKVLLLELNLQSGHNIDKMLNLPCRYALVNIINQLDKTDDPDVIKKAATPYKENIDILPTILSTGQITQFTASNIFKFFEKAVCVYDYIIVDTRRSYNECLVAVLQNSNLVILVATPDDLTKDNLNWGLDMLKGVRIHHDRIKLVINRADSRGGKDFESILKEIKLPVLAQIPSEGKTVGSALNRGIPCIIANPKSKVTLAILNLAKEFEKEELFKELGSLSEADITSEQIKSSTNIWNKLAAASGGQEADETLVRDKDDEEIALKRAVHARLVDVMNIDRMSPLVFTDAKRVMELRRQASELVDQILDDVDDFKVDPKDKQRFIKEIVADTFGLGALEDFMDDPDVSDIMVNSQKQVYIEKYGTLRKTPAKFVSEEQMRAIIDRIISPLGRRIDESHPLVDARMSDGSRFNAIIPPLSLTGPVITIRKFGRTRPTVDDLLNKFNSLNKNMCDFIAACVEARKNIIVSGGTGSGKTTLLNIVSTFIPDIERIITIEDAAELRINKRHWLRLESRPPNIEGKGAIPIRRLFMNSLHMRPDRIIVGECRGPEILDMLQAMNTGHDGSMTTLHANSPKDVLVRMSSMILLAGVDLPMRAIHEMISTALDMIVHVNRFADGTRKVVEISEITGLNKEHYIDLKVIFKFDQHGKNEKGTILGDYVSTGYVPKCNEEFKTLGIPIDEKMFEPSNGKPQEKASDNPPTNT